MSTSFSDAVRQRLESRPPSPVRPPGTIEGVEDPTLPMSERVRQRLRLREQGIDAPDPRALETETRSGFLGAQVGQDMVPGMGFDEFLVRADLGFSDTFEEKKKKFLSKYPDGDFVAVSEPPKRQGEVGTFEFGRGGKTILLRRNPNEPFIELDPPTFEMLGDLADLSGQVPAMVGEAFLTRGRSLVTQVLGAMAGNVAGNAFKEAVESLRDFQLESFSEAAQRVGTESLFAGGGAASTALLTGPINAIRGAAALSLRPGAREAQKAAKELDLPPLMPGQVAQNPLIQRLNAQAAALTTGVNQYLARQRRATVDALTRLRPKDLDTFIGGDNGPLAKLHDDAAKQIVAAARIQTKPLSEAGTAVAQGIAEYDNFARAAVSKAYKNASDIEVPEFDINGLRSVAADLKSGVQAPKSQDFMVPGDAGTVNVSPLEPELESVVNDILAIDPNEPVSLEVMQALRSRLWDAKTPNPGEIKRRAHTQAGTLYAAITKTIKDVKNSSPEFVEQWSKANQLAADRFTAMEKLMVIQASRTGTPAMMARKLVQPYQVDNLKTLRNVLPDEKWRNFQNAAQAEMVAANNLPSLTERLAAFDKETADLLFPAGRFERLQQIGRDFDRLQSLDLKGIIQRQDRAGAMVREMVETNNTRQITDILRLSKFDEGHPLRQTIRAGMIDDIYGQVVSNVKGELIVDGKKLGKILADYERTGVSRLLTKSDKDVLKNLESVTQIMSSSPDAGIALIAAGTAQSLLHLNREAIVSLIHNISIGRLMTSKFFQRLVTGRGAEALPFNNIRVFGAIVGNVLSDLRKDQSGSLPTETPQDK